MGRRSLSCVAVALILETASPRAQSADESLRRVGDWVHSFVGQVANAVAEEDYIPATGVVGRAYYQRFRRFSVHTTERVDIR